MARPAFELGAFRIAPGSRRTVDLPVSVLADHTPVSLSVHVVHGRRPGPTLFVSAAIHGDEVIGVEIARRLLRSPQLDSMRGTLLVVPIVNAFGFLNRSRYLPDRRDLNRSFPGSEHGSLAARLAHLFMSEIVERSDVGIDLHSAAIHRTNMPQIRVAPLGSETMGYADAFGAPVTIVSKLRDGSLRQAARKRGVDVLVFEAGEALRFDELSAKAGVIGVLRVMHAMQMIRRRGFTAVHSTPVRAKSSSWLRAPAGGLMRAFKGTGEFVAEGDLLGSISDPFGEADVGVVCDVSGIIVGRTNLPVVNEGDALFHVVRVEAHAAAQVDTLAEQLEGDIWLEDDEII